jgi:uncharacterized protein YbaP (TraB family)
MRWLFTVLAFLLVSCTASEGAIEKVEDARARNDGPAIWVARDDNSTLYLYGTVHLVPIDMDWQRDDLWEAFERAGSVWFEVPNDERSRKIADQLTRTKGYQSPGQRLSKDWDQFSVKTLEIASVSGDIPLPVLDTLRPWLAADLITLAAAQNAGLSADLSADEALRSRARRSSKYVRYLDRIQDQIALSADRPEAEQTENLLRLLERYNKIGPELNAIAQEWIEGDVQGLERRLAEAVTGENRERLFTARNGKWAEELTEWMEGSGTGFAAVGVGHLVGEKSLVEQLREKGLSVERYYAFQGQNVIRTIELEIDN